MAVAKTHAQGGIHNNASMESGAESDSTQYLSFLVDGELYGAEILRVQEIKGWTPVNVIPNTPDYIRGVLNLRGSIIPIIDMRMRFNMETVEYTPLTVVIVLSIQAKDGERVIGIVVDGVSDVFSIKHTDIKPAPDFGTNVNIDFIKGLATSGEQMVLLLELDKFLSMEGLNEIEEMTAQA